MRGEREAPGKLSVAVERQALALVGEPHSLSLCEACSAFGEVHLLIGVAVGELIVVRVVERLRERVADVVLIPDLAKAGARDGRG